jgi:thiol-disulfide isomerase/thioredoxin
MSQIIEILFRRYSEQIKLVFIFIFIIILTVVSVWAYYKYAAPAMNFNLQSQSDVANNGTIEEVQIYFFNVDWCPHCVKAKPEWKKFCDRRNGEIYKRYNINCVGGENGVDCTKTEDVNVVDYIQNFNIEHYPTVKMVKGGTTIDFDGKITDDNMETFIEGVLNT